MPADYSRKSIESQWFFSSSITLTNVSGVGGTTTLNTLEKRFGRFLRYVSGGRINRRFAEQLGMKIEPFVEHKRLHPEERWDAKCDEEIAQEGKSNNVIVEGRVPHIFSSHSCHILLTCPLTLRAERRQGRDPEYSHLSVEEVARLIDDRDRNDLENYALLYPGSNWLPEDFDAQIDTSTWNPEQVVDEIIQQHTAWRTRNRARIIYDKRY